MSGDTRPSVWIYVLLWLVLPPLAVGFQVAAETAAHSLAGTPFGPSWFARAATLPAVFWLVTFDAASLVAWMMVLEKMKVSEAFPASALSYVLVMSLGWTIYHEDARATEVVGGLAILLGIWLIGRDRRVDSKDEGQAS